MKRTTFLKSLLALSVIPFIPIKSKEEEFKYYDAKGNKLNGKPEYDGVAWTADTQLRGAKNSEIWWFNEDGLWNSRGERVERLP